MCSKGGGGSSNWVRDYVTGCLSRSLKRRGGTRGQSTWHLDLGVVGA